MAGIRDRVKDILKDIPPIPGQINSDGPTAALFTRLTGTSHETMWKNWQDGGLMTACNGFVGWYGTQLGSTKYLGVFELKAYLTKIGKGDSWVESTKDVRPKFGDICRHTAYHVGVGLDFDGDHWNHVDAGQGGPVRDKVTKELKGGRDILKRTRSVDPYDFKKLQGWLDLDLYFGSSAQSGPLPDWLAGWWKVSWRGQDYYYYFDRGGPVKWTQTAPRYTTLPILLAADTGTVTVDSDNTVTIRWGASGTVEKYAGVVWATDKPMQGKWNDSEPITANKM